MTRPANVGRVGDGMVASHCVTRSSCRAWWLGVPSDGIERDALEVRCTGQQAESTRETDMFFLQLRRVFLREQEMASTWQKRYLHLSHEQTPCSFFNEETAKQRDKDLWHVTSCLPHQTRLGHREAPFSVRGSPKRGRPFSTHPTRFPVFRGSMNRSSATLARHLAASSCHLSSPACSMLHPCRSSGESPKKCAKLCGRVVSTVVFLGHCNENSLSEVGGGLQVQLADPMVRVTRNRASS